jgi:hypothetical protein
MYDGRTESLVKQQGQGSMLTKTQRVHLVEVMDTPVVLSHNGPTRDECGNTCVQEDLTSWSAYYGQVRASCSDDIPHTTFFIPITYLE